MFSRDRKRAFAVVELKDADRAELQKAYADLRKEVRSGSLEVARDGRPTLNKDFEDTTESDLQRAELVSLPLALLMLLIVFGS
jgi:trehalose monomycolate/heme transporter